MFSDAFERGGALPDVPALPAGAVLPAFLPEGASDWLDRYVAFSRTWSPRSYGGFHEAAGLWVLSTVAARRVVLHVGKRFYTPLMIALTAPTSLSAKSTAAGIAIAVLRAAGLGWLLAADDTTPQRFLYDMTGRVPDDMDAMAPPHRERAMRRLAFPAQRGWFYEEFGGLLAGMTRQGGHHAEFRDILRRLDDCKDSFEYATLGRGTDYVRRPYLALLACLTPADIRPLARRGAGAWNDGFLARFAFVTPPTIERRRDRFPEGEMVVPDGLALPLRAWHDRLGTPTVTLADVLDAQQKKVGRKADRSAFPEAVCTLGHGVLDAFYAYHDGLLDLIAGRAERVAGDDLAGNYARLAEKAMRIAMLLASMENGGRIELRHWARGQAVAERWRGGLHALVRQVGEGAPSAQALEEEKLLDVLDRHPRLTANEARRYAHGLSTDQVRRGYDALVDAGVVRAMPGTRGARRYERAA